jgi:hypothetical protein
MPNEHANPSASPGGAFAERLKLEALAERPAFSDALHARIMQAVEAPHSASPSLRDRERRWSAARWVAIAAGLLVAALGVMQLGGSGDNRMPPNPFAKAPDRVAVKEPAGDTLSLDDLDHGAAVAVGLVVDQLPIEVPAVDWGSALVD